MARRPGSMALVAAVLCALLGLGFLRFAVDAGPDLLVGSGSDAQKVYDRFSSTFGSDPVVVVLAAQNPTAYYLEKNLLRLGALESDIARDPRVATVLGPGTIAGSAQRAAAGEINKVRDEYPYFVAETALASAIQRGERDPNKLSSIESNAYQAAQVAMAANLIKATQDADLARQAYNQHLDQHTGDQVLRGRELAAEQAASKTQPPPLFAQYIAGPQGKADDAGAQALFDRLSAGFGECSDQVAAALQVQASCQVFLERLFLDLPDCPPQTAHAFCPPKQQWAAVLPKPKSGQPSLAVITIRLKPQVVGHADQVNGLLAMIRDELDHGKPKSTDQVTRSLGAFAPTECGTPDTSGGATPDACMQRYHDAPAGYTIAGAPLLVQGVVGSMTHLLLALFPVALLVMLLLLLGAFRVRGRFWPLVGAAGAVLVTVGGGLLLGVQVSPAVLAGVPVLVGLGVDYGVQLVARFNEERGRGLGLEAALRVTLANTGPATLVAGVATLAGVAALAVLTFVDLGPLVAVPLVAEFALVLCAGVVFSWLAALLVALPAAAWRERRREREGELPEVAAAAEVPTEAPRTAALATRWRGVLVPAAVLAALGWALMPRIPVQTGVEQLLAPSLSELRDIQDVRGALGYDNEIDLAVQGAIGGGDANTAVPDAVVWMANEGRNARCLHPGDVALATTIGDVFAASSEQSTATSCTAPAPTPSPSPSASPSPSTSAAPSPAATGSASPSGSPSSMRDPVPGATPGPRVDGDVVQAGRVVAQATSPPASPSASAAPPSASPSAAGTAAPTATPVPTPTVTSPSASGTLQTAFLCSLRLLPSLAQNLVGPLPTSSQPCPVRDLYRNVFLGQDPTPVSPDQARIALGVRLTSVADQAKLIDQLTSEMTDVPKGITVTPSGLTALAAKAYDNLTARILLFNLVPLAVVALVLLGVFRDLRRALLPVLPAVLASGWSAALISLLGRLPGSTGQTLGSLNPLTVVLGALVVALGTEFGVVLLQRFYEERGRGLEPEAAAAAALHGVGRAVLVSAGTLGAGFAVLAASGLFPGGLPLIADFGLAVLIDLALAVGAVFLVMLPLAVALERTRPLPVPAVSPATQGFQRVPQLEGGPSRRAQKRAEAAARAEARAAAAAEAEAASAMVEPEVEEPEPVVAEEEPEPLPPPPPPPPAPPATAVPPLVGMPPPAPARFPSASGRRRPAGSTATPVPPPGGAGLPAAPRFPSASGRRRATAEPTPPPPPAAPVEPPQPAEPPRRRMPGGVTRRTTAASAPPPVAAQPEPEPEPPPSPPADEPPAPQQPHGGRSRRRRPPPWVRRNLPPRDEG